MQAMGATFQPLVDLCFQEPFNLIGHRSNASSFQDFYQYIMIFISLS